MFVVKKEQSLDLLICRVKLKYISARMEKLNIQHHYGRERKLGYRVCSLVINLSFI